jgi:uncharacterized protein YecT (DUF1311 family)
MKKLLLTLLLAATTLATRVEAQTVTQEQCKQADAQLNQVYQQLRGTLNEAQKQQLKQAQREWIKKRDSFVAANPGNPQGVLYQATMQRVSALQGVLQKVSGQSSGEGVTTQAHEETASPAVQQYGIYQQHGETRFAQVSDQELEKADADLNNVYQQLMQSLGSDEREKLKVGQRGWITQRDAIIAQQQNQRYALKYITEQRTRELKERLPDSYAIALNELIKTYKKYLHLLNEKEKQIFLANVGRNYEEDTFDYDGNNKQEKINKFIIDKKELEELLLNRPNLNNTPELEVALQEKHILNDNNGQLLINAVYLKKPDVLVTSTDREIKVWEVKSGRLLRNIPVSSTIDWIFPSEKENNIVAISIDRKWSGGETREINITNGNIEETRNGDAPYYQSISKISKIGITENQIWYVIGLRSLKSTDNIRVAGNVQGNIVPLKSNEVISSSDDLNIGPVHITGKELSEITGCSAPNIDSINLCYNIGSNRTIFRYRNQYILFDNTGGEINSKLKSFSHIEADSLFGGSNPRNNYSVQVNSEKTLLYNNKSTNNPLAYTIDGNSLSDDQTNPIAIKIQSATKEIYISFNNGKKIFVADINGLPSKPSQVALSEGDSKILTTVSAKLIGLDLKETKKSFSVETSKNCEIINPIISSDGNLIFYSSISNELMEASGSYMASRINRSFNTGQFVMSTWNSPNEIINTKESCVIQGHSIDGNVAITSSNISILNVNNKTGENNISYRPSCEIQSLQNNKYSSHGIPEYIYPKGLNSFISFKECKLQYITNYASGLKAGDPVSLPDVSCWNYVSDCDESSSGDLLISVFGKADGATLLYSPTKNVCTKIDFSPSRSDRGSFGSTRSRWIDSNHFFVASSEGLVVFGNKAQPIAFWKNPVSYPHGPYPGIDRWGFDAKSKSLAFASPDGAIRLFSICDDFTLKNRINIYLSTNFDPIFLTPENFYSTHSPHTASIAFTQGVHSYPLEQFDLRLNRPDIVLDRLGGPKEAIEAAKSLREKRLKRMGVTEEMLKPDFHLPELQIVGEVPATTSKDQLDLQIKATDDKYPLNRLRVYVNNVPVNGRDGELLREQKTKSLEKTISIKLADGRNKIQVSVLNSAGAESLYANAEVNCTAERPKPKLYFVALGVSQYDRPEWCLKYAAKDATDLIGKLKAKSGSTYSEVKPLLMTDKEVTKESTAKIKEFLSGATIDDTVLIFMAGHGILDDKYDYYFGTADIDPAKPSERGIPYEAIDTILAEVPSLRKALLMDTCHAGELDDDEKKELASSDGKGTLPGGSSTATDSAIKGTVAMRAIGTRGMTVKAVEGAKGKSDWYEKLQDMFVDLRRGSGATVISSSQGAEYAFESSEQSNGLFTYALMEALDGKATPNKDGKITISAIGDYVKKRVQDLTKGKQNPNLRGVNLEEDFTLGMAK